MVKSITFGSRNVNFQSSKVTRITFISVSVRGMLWSVVKWSLFVLWGC